MDLRKAVIKISDDENHIDTYSLSFDSVNLSLLSKEHIERELTKMNNRINEIVSGGEITLSLDYNDLYNTPDLTIYQTKAESFSKNYNDLIDKPEIPIIQNEYDEDSKNGMSGQAVAAAINASIGIHVDQTLDIDSENPIANKAVANALNQKMEYKSGERGQIMMCDGANGYTWETIKYAEEEGF